MLHLGPNHAFQIFLPMSARRSAADHDRKLSFPDAVAESVSHAAGADCRELLVGDEDDLLESLERVKDRLRRGMSSTSSGSGARELQKRPYARIGARQRPDSTRTAGPLWPMVSTIRF